jgi:hypothetical protein
MARFFNYYTGQWVDTQAEVRPPGSTPAATSAAAPAKTSNAEPVRVTVKQGQTLEQIAKENNTTVTQILSLPGNATIAARVEAGTQPVFGNSKVVIPPVGTPASASSGTTYNERVVDAIKSGTQATTDINANPVTKPTEKPEATNANVNPISGAPTSGPVVGFTPPFPMPGSTVEPGKPGFVGPVKPAEPVKPVEPKEPSPETKDAFEELGMMLKSWGLEDLADTYTRLMVSGKTAAQALTMLKYGKEIDPATGLPYNAAYTKRFAGNAGRIAAGMNAYDERTYIEVENAYEETLSRYGLRNMISTDRAANQVKYADYMTKGIAPTEFASRIQLVADRVINMDQNIKDTFKTYYPSLTDTDLVTYFLNPKETMPVLQAKVQAAEIGGAAKAQGLGVDQARAMELSKFGIDLGAARTGYAKVAEALPTGKKLSDIYGEEGIAYTQQVAEDEYLKEDAKAKLKRNRLASKERAMFSGQSGADSNSLQRGYSSAF